MTPTQLEAGAAKARQVAEDMTAKAKGLKLSHHATVTQWIGLGLMSDLFSGAALVMEAMAKADATKPITDQGEAA